MKDIDKTLNEKLKEALFSIEDSGDIVITSAALGDAAQKIVEKTKEAYIGELFTHDELVFFRMLTLEAASNNKMFCREMKALTNYSSEEAEALSDKPRKLTSYF